MFIVRGRRRAARPPLASFVTRLGDFFRARCNLAWLEAPLYNICRWITPFSVRRFFFFYFRCARPSVLLVRGPINIAFVCSFIFGGLAVWFGFLFVDCHCFIFFYRTMRVRSAGLWYFYFFFFFLFFFFFFLLFIFFWDFFLFCRGFLPLFFFSFSLGFFFFFIFWSFFCLLCIFIFFFFFYRSFVGSVAFRRPLVAVRVRSVLLFLAWFARLCGFSCA